MLSEVGAWTNTWFDRIRLVKALQSVDPGSPLHLWRISA